MNIIYRDKTYTIEVTPSGSGNYVGQCIEIPVIISQGNDMEDLRKNILSVFVTVETAMRGLHIWKQ